MPWASSFVFFLFYLWSIETVSPPSATRRSLCPQPVCRYYIICHPFLSYRFYPNKLPNSKFNARLYTLSLSVWSATAHPALHSALCPHFSYISLLDTQFTTFPHPRSLSLCLFLSIT